MRFKISGRRIFIICLMILAGFILALLLLWLASHKIELYKDVGLKSRVYKCQAHMEHIYHALIAYADDNPMLLFPKTEEGLNVLVEQKYLSSKYLRCPLANLHHVFGSLYWRQKVKKQNDYHYAPGAGLGVEMIPQAVCWDKLTNHGKYGKVNVLFSNGQIREFSPINLKKQIKKYLETLKNDSGINYIYFKWHGSRRFIMPECIIYSSSQNKLPTIAKSSWKIKVEPRELKKLGEILQRKLFNDNSKKTIPNSRYLVIINRGGMRYRRINEKSLDKQLQQTIIEGIPASKRWVLKQFFLKLSNSSGHPVQKLNSKD